MNETIKFLFSKLYGLKTQKLIKEPFFIKRGAACTFVSMFVDSMLCCCIMKITSLVNSTGLGIHFSMYIPLFKCDFYHLKFQRQQLLRMMAFLDLTFTVMARVTGNIFFFF